MTCDTTCSRGSASSDCASTRSVVIDSRPSATAEQGHELVRGQRGGACVPDDLDTFGQPIEAASAQRRPGDDDNSPAVLVHHPIVLLLAGSRPNLGLGPRRSTQRRRSGTTADGSPRELTASCSSFTSPDAGRVPPGPDRVGRSRDRASLAPPAPARARRTKAPARSIPVLGGRWAVPYFAFSIALSTSFAPLA